jgi:LuxR family transcriptional regulator, maltose regulon positive regulatory protein
MTPESDATVTQSRQAAEPDALLATKLHVPRPRPGFVARSRLASRLTEGLPGRLILVCAPAGFGKTALLAGWARDGSRPIAWLSLDEGDNDPARFWRHITAALEQVCPGIRERVGPLLGPPSPQSFEGVVTALVNDLAERPGGLLILDDYHLVDSEQVHAALAFLLEHAPPGFCLVIATRMDPPLRLGKLRARRELTELRAADLRFTSAEAAALLRDPADAAASVLSADVVEALTARTEGWAAGLQLAALSLRGQADAGAFVAAFSGSHRYVLDYLAEEVLDRQEPDVRDFLVSTSVLDRLSGDLCDAVTGRPGSQAMLERLERAGLFIVPLDEVRGWWRYHHLFRDLLRALLYSERPRLAPGLHRGAAAWQAGHGMADEAIGHAVAAGDTEWAAELIEQNFDAVYFTGENATLQRWLAAVGEDLARRRTRLGLVHAFMALTGGDLPKAAAALAAIGDEPAAPDDFRPSVGPDASFIGNVPAATAIARAWLAYLHGDAEQMTRHAALARDRLGDGDGLLHSIYQLNVALVDWLSGRLAQAEQSFAAAIDGWLTTGQRALAAQGWNVLGQIRYFRGDLDAAQEAYGELLKITELPSGTSSPVAGLGHVGMAEIRYQRGDLAGAREALAVGLPLCRQISDRQALATGLAALAWIQQSEGDSAGARATMAEAERAGPSSAVADLLSPAPAQRARLLLAHGDLGAAARWAEAKGLSPDDDPVYPREREYLVLARVLIAQGHSGQALGLLRRLLEVADSQGRVGSVIGIRVQRALTLAAGADLRAAVQELTATLALAAPQGLIRVFADEGPPMARLLDLVLAERSDGRKPAPGVPVGYLAAVRRACEPPDVTRAPAGRAGASVPGLIEPLTPRETEVLELLAVGAPNQRIAERLVVTLDTVKKHVTHVLAKLGAANRTEAVVRARELGLLS